MIEKTRVVEVTNRDFGRTGYHVPDGNIDRQFEPGETKRIPFEELEKLVWVPGGEYILRNCLVIKDREVVSELLRDVEQEYYYTEKDVIDLMKYGTLDQFLDCLDFAPEGVKEMIKNLAVKLPLNDVQKREAILNSLGFDVTAAIRLRKEAGMDDKVEDDKPKRRATAAKEEVAVEEEPQKPTRRYKVVDKK